jgi:hypothetical protein
MGDAGVKAGLVVVGGEAAVAGAVVAAPAVVAAASPTVASVTTAVTNASINAYVTTTSAIATAGAAIQNGARAVINASSQLAVRIDTLKSGGGAFNAAGQVVQAATSSSRPPAPNKFGAVGLAIKIAIKLLP